MPRFPVAIVGGGPVGLALALGLARHGISSVLLEKKASTSEHSKAPGIHVRTREILRLWGIEDRFLRAGELIQCLTMVSAIPGRRPLTSLDYREIESEAERPGLLILEQSHTERLLLEAVRETGLCDVRFDAEVIGLAQGADSATVTFVRDGLEDALEAEFVVGCDGASSFVRKALGLSFEGSTYSLRPMLADVRVGDERDGLAWPRAWDARGSFAFAVRLEPDLWRVISLDRKGASRPEEVPGAEVDGVVSRLLGPGPVEVVWASRFRIHIRSTPRFRVGRVLLAGDAAHLHSPSGGFGMNGGIQDAHNLAWKIAAALGGGDTDRLLDSYDVERRAVIVEKVSRYTDLVTRAFLDTPPVVRRAVLILMRVMLKSARFRVAGLRRTTMIDLDYPPSPLLKKGWPSAGIRLPNPMLVSPDGRAIRLYDLLPIGPAILDVAGDSPSSVTAPLEHVIRIGSGGYADPTSSLQGLLDEGDGWILVRPDAHVAWALDRRADLDAAIRYALGRCGIACTGRDS